MSTSRTQRRLAAIFAADVVGYSRLWGRMTGTLAALKAFRTELIDPRVRNTQVGLSNRPALVEFPSVVNAVGGANPCLQRPLPINFASFQADQRNAYNRKHSPQPCSPHRLLPASQPHHGQDHNGRDR
jgi:adenylate cyclase